MAAKAALHGMTGSPDILDGEMGMGRTMSDGPDWSSIASTVGQDFHICRMTFKNHIGCGHTFAAIDGGLALQRTLGAAADDIARVHVATYRPALDIACYERPTTENEARFSLKYVVASALARGSVRLAAYSKDRLEDPVTRGLMERMTIAVDPEIDEMFSRQRAARIEIETRSGERGYFFQANRKGDPEEPLTDADLGDKLLELASPITGSERSITLLEALIGRICRQHCNFRTARPMR